MRAGGLFAFLWIFTLSGWCGRQESGKDAPARGKGSVISGGGNAKERVCDCRSGGVMEWP